MTETVNCTYRAFLSYSHADTPWALWLHSALEGFGIDKDLVGRVTDAGRIPPSLRPIFRDRDDFAAGHTLNAQTLAALNGSSALIVVCSPAAARSHYVNEEIRLYKYRHAGRPIIPVIVAGRPGGGEDDCFPPALKFKIDPQGHLTSAHEPAILAADARDAADGRDLALAKVVATLIGVPLDDVRKRHAIAEMRRIRITSAVATSFAIVAVIAGYLFYENWTEAVRHETRDRERQVQDAVRDKQLAEMKALVQDLLKVSSAQAAPGADKAVASAVADAAKGAAEGDERLKMALELLKAGKPKEAEPLFRAVAEEKGSKVQQDKKDTATAYRNLGAIAGLRDPKKAREAYAKALEFDPEDTVSLYWVGTFSLDAGNLPLAQQSLTKLLRRATAANDQSGMFGASLRLGEVEIETGNLNAALKYEERAIEIARKQSIEAPDDHHWPRDLSVALNKRGDVLRAQGKGAEALESYREGLATLDRLIKTDAGNVQWIYDTGISNERIGEALLAGGDLDGALAAYQKKQEQVSRLVDADPLNVSWQRDLALAREKIGNVYFEQGKLSDALAAQNASLANYQRIADSDPANAEWRRDVAVSKSLTGDILFEQKEFVKAREAYKSTLDIFAQLARANPESSARQRDLSEALFNLGKVHQSQNELPEALEQFNASLAIRQNLVKTDPNNAVWRHDLALAQGKIGETFVTLGDVENASRILAPSHAAAEQLAKDDANNSEWQYAFAMSHLRLGDLQAKSRSPEGALDAYRKGSEILRSLLKIAPNNARWRKDLELINSKIAELGTPTKAANQPE